MKKTLVASSLSLILLAGCAGGGGGNMSAAVDKPQDAPLCAASLECNQLAVPTNYINDDGSKVNVFYSIHKATDKANRIGTLFVNFGGPGQEAQASLALMIKDGKFDKKIVQRFDIVALDPRGSGQSAYADELKQCAAKINNDVTACDDFNQNSAVNISTNTFVKDIDALRAHLGEEQISFLGYSYGTRVGSVYADLFPERVRALVLDSPVSPNLANHLELTLGQAKSYDVVATHRLGSAQRKQTLEQGINDLFYNGAFYGLDGELSFDDSYAALNALASSDSSGYWQHQKPGVIELLDTGNVSLLKQLIASTSWFVPDDKLDASRSRAMFRSVICTDEVSPLTFDEVNALKSTFSQASGVYGLKSFYTEADLCIDWAGQHDPVMPITNMDTKLSPPVLIIGGQYDPSIPYFWVEEMAASFASLTRFIRVDNMIEHAFSYRRGNACVDNATTAYLLDPSLAADELVCSGSTTGRHSAEGTKTTGLKPHPAALNPHF